MVALTAGLAEVDTVSLLAAGVAEVDTVSLLATGVADTPGALAAGVDTVSLLTAGVADETTEEIFINGVSSRNEQPTISKSFMLYSPFSCPIATDAVFDKIFTTFPNNLLSGGLGGPKIFSK